MTHDERSTATGELSRRQAALRRHSGEHTVAVFTLDAHGRVASWNPDAERVQGYRSEDIRGRHFSVFYPPEDVAAGYPDAELARAAEVGVHLDEGWRVRQDGSTFWAYIVIAAQRSEQGRIRGFTKVVRDDTESQLRHQRSDQRFSDLLALAPMGVGLFDEHDRIREVNTELCRLTGYSRPQLLDLAAHELLPPDERGHGFQPETGHAHDDTGTFGPQQRTLLRSDGRSVPCEVRYARSVQDDGCHFWLVTFQDITVYLRQAELLQHQAHHDALTGLANQRGLAEVLQHVTADTAVLLCDVDNFKRVNDSLGHPAGDELIVQLARRLDQAQLPGCTLARRSGDEFVLVCTELEAAGGLQPLAERVAELLRTTVSLRGHVLRISASVGAARLSAETTNGENLLRHADAAMFTAKNRGSGQVQLAEEGMLTRLSQQVELEEQLTQALRSDELALYYQPIVNNAQSLIAVEALLRWPHPQRGLLSPASILPTAEQAGLVRELDQWVLRTALQHAAGWPDTADGPVRVSVNLNNHTTTDATFLTRVHDTLAHYDVEAHRLVLEITETSLLELPTETWQAVRGLIQQGVSFALDDFGTGYSSLGRLKTLPADIIKLDRQFVTGIETHEADRAIVRSAVDMAHATGKHCVAEGVETTLQYHLLAALGVDAYQGFRFAYPEPNQDLHARLARLPQRR